jgi:ribose/xylose/arabinose/galactoside ABC-type transport system permease subunit
MLTLLSGITELLLGGKWITQMPASLREFGTGGLAGIPYSVIVALCVAAAGVWLAARTPFGRHVYALGSNPHAARQLGLSARRTQLAIFTLTGLLVGVAALFSATQLQVIEAGFGKGFELTVVAAVVLGGTSIRGGRGSVVGSVLGAVLLGVLGTMLVFLRLGDSSVYWERAIQGGLILVAVLADTWGRSKGPLP